MTKSIFSCKKKRFAILNFSESMKELYQYKAPCCSCYVIPRRDGQS